MGDFGIKRNASGYYDETAYKAIKNMPEVMDGDIWQDKDGREYVVIKNHGNFCSSLRLNEEKSREGEICVKSRAIRYTHPGMIQYTFQTMLKTFVKSMQKDDFTELLHAVGNALGVTVSVENVETDEQTKRIKELEDKCAALEHELHKTEETEKVDDITWKMMYENLLDKVVKRM